MSEDFRDVGRDELREKIEAGDDFVLVDALPPMSYALSHLPSLERADEVNALLLGFLGEAR